MISFLAENATMVMFLYISMALFIGGFGIHFVWKELQRNDDGLEKLENEALKLKEEIEKYQQMILMYARLEKARETAQGA